MNATGKRQTDEKLKELYIEAAKECNRNMFIHFVKCYRKKSLALIKKGKRKIRNLQNRSRKSFKEYQKICRKFTKLTIKHEDIDVTDRGWNKIHIDHIIPVYHAWRMNLSPYLIGMSANLQRLTKKENEAKGRMQLLLTQ